MSWYKQTQTENDFNTIKDFIKTFPYERAGEISFTNGQCGEGVYAYPSQNVSMKEYYSKDGQNIYLIRPHPDAIILNLTTGKAKNDIIFIGKKRGYKTTDSNYHKELWAIKEYLYDKHYDAYLLPHAGYGIPSGSQLIITNIDKFDFVSKNQILEEPNELV